MMKASELRIGNWVNLYDDYNSQVTGLTNTKKVWCVSDPTDEECAWSTDKIKPIPLTEEWLLNFGFEIEEGDFMTLNYKGVFLSSTTPFKEVVCESYHESTIQHVHQLQNFYYAITGEEITIL